MRTLLAESCAFWAAHTDTHTRLHENTHLPSALTPYLCTRWLCFLQNAVRWRRGCKFAMNPYQTAGYFSSICTFLRNFCLIRYHTIKIIQGNMTDGEGQSSFTRSEHCVCDFWLSNDSWWWKSDKASGSLIMSLNKMIMSWTKSMSKMFWSCMIFIKNNPNRCLQSGLFGLVWTSSLT